MNSIDFIEELLKELSFDNDIKMIYNHKYNWAIYRKNAWEGDKIRVGVIGVTSSGKSTLINAIIGSDILSSAIAPSSGQLVCCSYGSEYMARISFFDKKDKILSGNLFSSKELMEYSDERKNPQNQKNVKSIEIQSPHFDLGKEVLLIDSPGVDAFGLESHEKLTLETLVPTIDICIYVTTMKTNSDKKAKEILNVVARYGCPLIIVQNMLDAVRPSPSGDKSREQVALDHYNRMLRIVNQSNNDLNDVEVIQISADHAKKWRLTYYQIDKYDITQKQFDKSNYTKFIAIVKDFIYKKKPVIENQRIENITNEVDGILNDLDKEINGIAIIESKEKDYKKIKNNINKIRNECVSNYNKVIDDIDKWVEQNWDNIQNASVQNIERYVNDVNRFINDVGSRIKNIISDCNNKLSNIAKELNVPIRDILKSPALSSFKDVKVEKKIEKGKPTRVKESGAFGGVKRFFGTILKKDWGYRYVEGKEYVTTDVETTIKKINIFFNDSIEKYSSIYNKWLSNDLNKIIEKLIGEVEIEEKAYNARKEVIVQNEKKRELFNRLSRIKKDLNKENTKLAKSIRNIELSDKKIKSINGQTIKIDVGKINSLIVRLARISGRNQHKRVMFEYVKLKKLEKYDPVILGWDESCIEDFIWKSGISNFEKYNLNEYSDRLKNDARSKCFFILVNAMQFGSAEKQIRMLNLEKIIKTKDYIFWVIQDFEELINGNGITEGLQKMIYLKNNVMSDIRSVIWIVHDNPIYPNFQ